MDEGKHVPEKHAADPVPKCADFKIGPIGFYICAFYCCHNIKCINGCNLQYLSKSAVPSPWTMGCPQEHGRWSVSQLAPAASREGAMHLSLRWLWVDMPPTLSWL